MAALQRRFQLLQQLHQRAAGTILRAQCKPLSASDIRSSATRKLASRMSDTMWKNDGVGFAAPQVGKTFRMFVAQLDEDEEPKTQSSSNGSTDHPTPATSSFRAPPPPSIIINPLILRSSRTIRTEEESCLSVPGITALVPRPESIDVSYTDLDGRVIHRSLHGFPARIFQHEVDHLDGKLFIDRIENVQLLWTFETFPGNACAT